MFLCMHTRAAFIHMLTIHVSLKIQVQYMLKSLQAKRIWEHRESNRNCKTNKKGVYSHRFKFQWAQTILWDCSYDLAMLFSICLHLLLKYNLQIFCDFLDLKLLNSCSNQEFNMLSKIIQKALHVDQYGRASLRGHTCYLWAEASSALPLFPDILLRRAISFLLPCERPRNPLPATPLQRQSVPYGRYTTRAVKQQQELQPSPWE